MDYNEIKLSDITKALRKAGFKAVTVDSDRQPQSYYKYKGGLYINGANVSFAILGKRLSARGKYATGAMDSTGAVSEELTDWPQLFYPRLFGYLNGEISEVEIIAEICA